MVDCPRCSGKGNVDFEDIKRLKKEAFWIPGQCAYCKGIGKVPPDRIKKVPVDLEYLTTDLTGWERLKVLNGDEEALKRAKEEKEAILKFVEEIEHLYYIENKEANEIADYFFHKHRQYHYSETEKQQIVDYVKKVIGSKLQE